jgi:glutamate-ammonia-ligase adenylyltransferase
VGKEFTCTIEELVCRRDDKAALASDIRARRRRMEEELGKEDAAHYNVKQGAGGLVDIEFLAQFFQLAHGSAYQWLRVPGTYNALRALRKKKLLDEKDYRTLMNAYLFMRLLESRMRIVTNQATNQLMRDPAKLHPLARRMGYRDDTPVAGRKLLADYERMREEVRGVFERVVVGRC